MYNIVQDVQHLEHHDKNAKHRHRETLGLLIKYEVPMRPPNDSRGFSSKRTVAFSSANNAEHPDYLKSIPPALAQHYFPTML